MPHANSDGVDIYYDVTGDADDPVIVLLSGTGAQLVHWHPDLVTRFVGRGFRVVRIDNRDTGLSQRFGDPTDLDGHYGIEDMGDDVVRVLDHLGVRGAHLVGHSMGGMIAQMTVIRHPERVRSLGLLSTIPGQDPRYILHGEAVIEQPPRFSRDEVIEFGAQGALGDSPGVYDPQLQWYRREAAEAYDRGYSPEGVVRQVSALIRAPERLELLRATTVPALVFHGRDDGTLHWCAAVDIAEAIAGSELQIHPGMGHLVPHELWPELVAGVVRTARRADDPSA